MRITWLNLLIGCLAAIGALNWGSVGLFDLNIVRSIFGGSKSVERTVYSIVGLAGLFTLFSLILSRLGSDVNPTVTVNVPGHETYEP